MAMLVMITVLITGQPVRQEVRLYPTMKFCTEAKAALLAGAPPELGLTQRFDCLEVER